MISGKKILSLLVAIPLITIQLSACSMKTKVIGEISDPKPVVTSFFEQVSSGNCDNINSSLYNQSLSMNMLTDDGSFNAKLQSYMMENFKYHFIGDAEVTGLTAKQQVQVSYLDLNLMAEDIKKTTTQLTNKYIKKTDERYTETSNGVNQLTESGAKLVTAEALDILMKHSQDYISSKFIVIDLKYTDKQWHVIVSNELFDILTGRLDVNN